MSRNFTTQIVYNGQTLTAVILAKLQRDGMHYEVNIPGYPRFSVKWSAADRYDIVSEPETEVPYGIVLAVSDAIEAATKKG
jgi:uncharacterized protein YueI